MTAKQYLRRAEHLKEQIARTQRRINELRDDMSRPKAIRYDKDIVQSSPTDPMIEYMERLEDLLIRENELRIMYTHAYNTICRQIDEMENPLYAEVLSMRYLDGYTLLQISDRLHHSHRYIENVHGYALQAFAKQHNIR